MSAGRRITLIDSPPNIQVGKADALFGFIADCIGDFVGKHRDKQQGAGTLHLGFTFSFPVDQTNIDEGKLIRWTKGFDCRDGIGRDVVQMLQTQLEQRNINVRVRALMNDTVGTLLASAYEHHGRTILGGIYGTGTNGAYIEKMSEIRTLANVPKGAASMVINTEWGGYDSEVRMAQRAGLMCSARRSR